MQTDLRFILLIIGLVIVAWVAFDMLRRHRKVHKRDNFDATTVENPHHASDPLLEEKVPPKTATPASAPSDIISIGVMAEGAGFTGAALSAAFKACHLVRDSKGLYCREHPNGPSAFHVVSMVEPGTFEAQLIGQRPVPGIMLFMVLPSPVDALNAFDDMINTLNQLNQYLGGSLCNERYGPLSGQALSLYRERVQEFERQRLLARAR